MSVQERFKQFLTERLTIAASEIFGVFEQLIVDYQIEMDRSSEVDTRLQLPVLSTSHRTGVQRSSSPDLSETKEEPAVWTTREEEEPELWTTREEEEPELWSTQKEEDPSQLHRCAPTVETSRDALPTNPADGFKVEPQGEDNGAPEPASDLLPATVVPSDCPTTLRLARKKGEQPIGTESTTSVTTFTGPSMTTFPKQEIIYPSQVDSIDDSMQNSPIEGLLQETGCILQTYEKTNFECGKYFRFKSKLHTHLKIHTGDKSHNAFPGQATSTNSTGLQTIFQEGVNCFSSEGALQNHMQTHIEDQLYQCQEGGKEFTRKGTVLIHMKTHKKEKPYQCQVCNRFFSQKYNLKTHMKTHTGERPHHCQACGKSFIQKRDLINHSRLHTGETPYQCQECGQSFSYQSALKSHNKKHIRARNKKQKVNSLMGCGDI